MVSACLACTVIGSVSAAVKQRVREELRKRGKDAGREGETEKDRQIEVTEPLSPYSLLQPPESPLLTVSVLPWSDQTSVFLPAAQHATFCGVLINVYGTSP